MARQRTLHDDDGVVVYPNTLAKCIYNDDGSKLSDKIGEIDITHIGDGSITSAIDVINRRVSNTFANVKINGTVLSPNSDTASTLNIIPGNNVTITPNKSTNSITVSSSYENTWRGVQDNLTSNSTDDSLTANQGRVLKGLVDEKAPLDNPTLTGIPKAPTATVDTNDTQIATTAFVQSVTSGHNTSSDSHTDIRELISGLTERLNGIADSDDETLDQLSEIVAYIKNNKSLIDSITTSKISVSDIVDNLTSTSTNKPLSAKQGKILNDLLDTLTGTVNTKIDGVNGDTYIGSTISGTTASITHKDVTRSNTTSTASPSHGGNFTAVKSVTSDAKGHVTGVDTETVTLPTYGTGTASAAGLTKLYTGTGTATDGTMTQNAINSALSGKAASSHNHAAGNITAGTFAATGIKAATGTDYTTARIRNIQASTTDLTAGSSSLASGDIYIVYE